MSKLKTSNKQKVKTIKKEKPATSRGFEHGIDTSDIIIPRAKLLQLLSPELQEGIEGVKTGSIINSLTKEVLPERFIPIFCFKNWMRFNPRDKDDKNFNPDYEAGAIIWKVSDKNDPRVKESEFSESGDKPLAITCLNFLCAFEGVDMPIIVSFSKTSYNAGKQLLSLSRFCQGDMFSRSYKLTSVTKTNDISTFNVFKVMPFGSVSEPEFEYCASLWKELSNNKETLKIDDIE